MTVDHFLDLVARRATTHGGVVALEAGSDRVTFQSLWGLALETANSTFRDVPHGSVVALPATRGVGYVVRWLAVLCRGAAFVPYDSAAPRSDAERRLSVSRATHILDACDHLHVVDETFASNEAHRHLGDFAGHGRRGDLLYVMVTSGTTGEPRAVAIAEKAVRNYVHFETTAYGTRTGDRVLQFCSPLFDISTEETLPALALGATLVFPPEGALVAGVAFETFLGDAGISITHLPTGYWNQWMLATRGVSSLRLPRLRLVITGGEALSRESLKIWFDRAQPANHLVDVYGLTETSMVSTWRVLESVADYSPAGSMLGQPLPNVGVRVDSDGGAPGEILISGDGLGAFFPGNPRDTADRFRPAPGLLGGQREYRTGDLGTSQDEQICLIGRLDRQTKVGGFRFNPAVTEDALRAHGALNAHVARVDETLVAFVVLSQGVTLTGLKKSLAADLPRWSLPQTMIAVDAISLTANGKVDSRAMLRVLPRDLPSSAELSAVAVCRELEMYVSPPDDGFDFLSVGVDSMLAVRMADRLTEVFGRECDPVWFVTPGVGPPQLATCMAARPVLERTSAPIAPSAPVTSIGTYEQLMSDFFSATTETALLERDLAVNSHDSYMVVINVEEQYSIWQAGREVPDGWTSAGFSGTKDECLDHIEAVWTDMRPASLRRAMDGQ